MELREAISARKSVRAFLDTPVSLEVLERIVIEAARAPSGGNLQPWHVDLVVGDAIERLRDIMKGKLERREREEHAYAIYPETLPSMYEERRFEVGDLIYSAQGISRDDKKGRRDRFNANYSFFGAPAALFVTVGREMGPPQWSDLGMYLQSVMLLAMDAGLATCPQECWATFPETIGDFLDIPAGRMLFCGMAIGYEDTAHPTNHARTPRAPRSEWLTVNAT